MGLFSISDTLIAFTLIFNALALLTTQSSM